MVRLQPDALVRLDGWIAAQPAPRPTRPEAIRQLIALGINSYAGSAALEVPSRLRVRRPSVGTGER